MDDAQCIRLINEHPFAVMFSTSPIQATHLPMEYDPEDHALICHLARANGHWKDLDGQEVLVVFNGPHAYISPGMYAAGPAVPTWNYAAVHVEAIASLLPMKANARVTAKMAARYEPDYDKQTGIYDEQYVDKLNKAIVSVRLDIKSMHGKLKLGQQRSAADQQGVLHALQQGDMEAQQLAAFMQDWQLGCGDA